MLYPKEMRHHDIPSHSSAGKAASVFPTDVYMFDEAFILTGLRGVRNHNAVSSEHDWCSKFYLCVDFSKKHICEPVGFGPMLRSRNDRINLLLMLKIV